MRSIYIRIHRDGSFRFILSLFSWVSEYSVFIHSFIYITSSVIAEILTGARPVTGEVGQ